MRDPRRFIVLGLEPEVKISQSKIERLTISGKMFKTASGNYFFYKGVTAFQLLDLFSKGIDISSFLDAFKGYNTLRIFWYTPTKDWGAKAWGLPPVESLLEFHKYVGECGFYVENCCITDDDKSKLTSVKSLISILSAANLDNVFLEAVNEPYIHDKLEPLELKNALSGSGYLYTSGIYIYEQLDKFFGKYVVNHSDRTADWPRKAKDSEDLQSTFRIPAVQDEPIRPETAGYNELDFYTYGAAAKLFGNGVTFHFLNGEYGQLPNDGDAKCAAALLKGVKAFPLGACLGDYEHLRDLEEVDSEGNPTKALRVFRKGNYMIVIRPNGFKAPSNWKPLDEFGICWSK